MFDLSKFDNVQLDVLNSYNNTIIFEKLCDCIDSNYTPEQIEVIGKALCLGIDVSKFLNPRLSLECMLLLCDASRSGIDINGLDNVYIDSDLLAQIIKIKVTSNHDISFIRNLNLSQCRDFVKQFNENKNFDISPYANKIGVERKKTIMEIEYAFKANSK